MIPFRCPKTLSTPAVPAQQGWLIDFFGDGQPHRIRPVIPRGGAIDLTVPWPGPSRYAPGEGLAGCRFGPAGMGRRRADPGNPRLRRPPAAWKPGSAIIQRGQDALTKTIIEY